MCTTFEEFFASMGHGETGICPICRTAIEAGERIVNTGIRVRGEKPLYLHAECIEKKMREKLEANLKIRGKQLKHGLQFRFNLHATAERVSPLLLAELNSGEWERVKDGFESPKLLNLKMQKRLRTMIEEMPNVRKSGVRVSFTVYSKLDEAAFGIIEALGIFEELNGIEAVTFEGNAVTFKARIYSFEGLRRVYLFGESIVKVLETKYLKYGVSYKGIYYMNEWGTRRRDEYGF